MKINLNELLFGRVRGMHHVNRYSSVPLSKAENVAEHSWQVAFISYAIALDLRSHGVTVAMGQLLREAIMHDVEEGLSGDIIRSFKYKTRQLEVAISDANVINMAGLTGELFSDDPHVVDYQSDERPDARAFFDWQHAKSELLEGRIVALADMLCVVSKCVEEHRMGNRAVNYILRAMYEENLAEWHDREFVGQYVNALFPNRRWSDPLDRS